ncbi:MAG: hypothetical protein UV40_C0021G0033 [Parcubacteria group bacterium GW2011_GWA1_42_7]|nr:MAG: hypothetical protein UV34_C0019G0006 [Parcubacteria group bacterium GW2011_GWB1_42_6]KKS69532.1 MAG: hypothetical protein UV40_C0021G0033 [Parcubacteria group bacterium GW2011_GWA1_42_7]KKS91458.1 MAG: hypothetical protein UV67_C0027G0019 [Parcubacteria group bacterium GW2011_GWC1_43_12]
MELPLRYSYLFLCLILSFFWLLFFLVREDLRREMIWASFLGLPFGFIDYFLVPEYWHPESLFSLMEKYGVGLESFVFLFLMSGIVSVIYEFLEGIRTKRVSGKKKKFGFLPLFLAMASFFVLVLLFSLEAIYGFMLAGLIGALGILYLRRDLLKQISFSAFFFAFFYFAVFFLTIKIFPGIVEVFYNLENTWGVLVLGVPLEELAVGFFVGAFWSAFYECAQSYHLLKSDFSR